MFGELRPLVFDETAEIYNRHGIKFANLIHLESIGLIQFDSFAGFKQIRLPKSIVLHYYGRPLHLNLPNDADNKLDIGKALLTRIGKELAPICGSKPVEGFWEYVKDQWKQYLPKPKTE